MVFNIAISANGLKSLKGKDYAMMIADTVAVRSSGPDVLTGKIPKKYEDISYALEANEAPAKPQKSGNDRSKSDTKKNLPTSETLNTGRRTRHDGLKTEFDESRFI